MDISFILSADEIFTLMSLFPEHTEAGKRFINDALVQAKPCDLSSLAEKKMTRLTGGDYELAPVVRMIADSMARADSSDFIEGVWYIRSPWILLRCEEYPYRERHWRISPLYEGADEELKGDVQI